MFEKKFKSLFYENIGILLSSPWWVIKSSFENWSRLHTLLRLDLQVSHSSFPLKTFHNFLSQLHKNGDRSNLIPKNKTEYP